MPGKSVSYKYDFINYIGRFQPLHLGHEHVIRLALEMGQRVILHIGSANLPIGFKNSWSFEERKAMIRAAFADIPEGRLIIVDIDDHMYNDNAWLAQVQSKVTEVLLDYGNGHGFRASGTNDFKVGIIGFEKDDTSFYLRMFPQWERILLEEQWGTINATQIRGHYFQRMPILPHDVCSEPVIEGLRTHMLTEQFKYIVDECEEIAKCHKAWDGSPFAPHFCTTDVVATQSGHILLTERTNGIGKGLLSLPGTLIDPDIGGALANAHDLMTGHVAPGDKHGMIPPGKVRGFYVGKEMRFDNPGRDPRGFYSTNVFRYVFPDGPLYDVFLEGEEYQSDWYPIGELKPENMFLDHYFIIQAMLNRGE